MRTILFRTSLAGMLAASALYAQSESHHVATRYTVTDLGVVGAPPAQPFVIRDNGLISGGVAVTGNTWHAVLWFQGRKIDIAKPGLGGPSNVAFGVNERGQTVGEAETADSDPNGEDFCGFGSQRVCQPFIWQNGLMTPLPPLKDKTGGPGRNGVANAINNRGQVAGTAENTERDSTCPALNPALGQYQQFQFKPVIWENGTTRDLPTVSGDPDGIAFAINDSGQAVGASGVCTHFLINGDLTYLHSLHAALWENGTVTDLGNLGGIAGGGGNVANDINNRGQVVGHSGTASGLPHGFLWSKETGIQDLGTVGNDIGSVALGINDGGDITGISFDGNFNPRAFLRLDGGVPTDLNSLIPAGSPLFLFDACSINSSGEIIGIAVDGTGAFHGYLATPSSGGHEDSSDISHAATSPFQFEYARKLLHQRLGSGLFGARPIAPR